MNKNQICFVRDKKKKGILLIKIRSVLKDKKWDFVNKNQICFVKDKKILLIKIKSIL